MKSRRRIPRKKKKTRRVRGGAKPISATLIRNTIPLYFPANQTRFELAKKEKVHYKITIKCSESSQFRSQSANNESMIHQEKPMYALLYGTTLTLEMLTRCNGKSGKEMLDTWIEFSKAIGVTRMELLDNSMIYVPEYGKGTCGLPLPLLSILSKGETWYESRGFRSNTYEADRTHNEKTRSMEFSTFMEQIEERSRRKDVVSYSEFKKAFPEIDEMKTTGEVFAYLQSSILRPGHQESIQSCEDPRLFIIQTILRAAGKSPDPLIQYNPDLFMNLEIEQ